jgi:peptide/nickel transport system substrate-binding protein
MGWPLRLRMGVAVVALAAGGIGWSAQGPPSPKHSADPGGSLTALQGPIFGTWPGLDPATDTSDAADHDYLNAIYGELFEQGPKGAIPDLASGYKLSSDLQTLDIFLRHGVSFQDGTPFDAEAVAFNIRRDLEPQYACICLPSFPVASISTPDSYTVVLHLSRPFAPIVAAFFSEAPNWIVSPTALQKMGERAFALAPVGAGPFEVASNLPNTKLVLTRNPHYWQKGRPFLDRITFLTVGNDQSAYGALLSGQGQTYEEFSTYSLIPKIKGQLRLTPILPSPTGASFVQLNTTKPPFNNILAREAIYYATDPGPINRALYNGKATPTQSLRAPGELFYEPKVPGYRTYDLAKAKALVKQLGGLSIVVNASPPTSLATALMSEWARAGIKSTLNLVTFAQSLQNYRANNWELSSGGGGGYDPGILLGLPFYFESTAPFTGVHDPVLDQLIHEGVSVGSLQARAAIYRKIYKYISDKAYAPVLFFAPLYNVTVHNVTGPGLTTPGPEVFWEDVKLT